jgi:YgiT-type zinc finger domain-containing protein
VGRVSETEVTTSAFKCHVCGGETATDEFASEVLDVDGRRVLVEQFPARVCTRCAEASFSRQTTERIRLLVHGADRPFKTVPLEVFELV